MILAKHVIETRLDIPHNVEKPVLHLIHSVSLEDNPWKGMETDVHMSALLVSTSVYHFLIVKKPYHNSCRVSQIHLFISYVKTEKVVKFKQDLASNIILFSDEIITVTLLLCMAEFSYTFAPFTLMYNQSCRTFWWSNGHRSK